MTSVGADHWRLAVCRTWVGSLFIDLKRYPEAEEQLVAARDSLLATLGETHHHTQRAITLLHELHSIWDEPASPGDASRYSARHSSQ